VDGVTPFRRLAPESPSGYLGAVIATLNADGLLSLPQEIREAARRMNRERFDVLVSTSGVLLLRPQHERKRSLAGHFRALQGLAFEHLRDPIPDPASL
jgi:hypothetical protein